jgi:hypothetical protein
MERALYDAALQPWLDGWVAAARGCHEHAAETDKPCGVLPNALHSPDAPLPLERELGVDLPGLLMVLMGLAVVFVYHWRKMLHCCVDRAGEAISKELKRIIELEEREEQERARRQQHTIATISEEAPTPAAGRKGGRASTMWMLKLLGNQISDDTSEQEMPHMSITGTVFAKRSALKIKNLAKSAVRRRADIFQLAALAVTDATPEHKIPLFHAAVSGELAELTRVEARYRGEAFLPGKVSAYNGDRTYNIDYDNGEKEDGVSHELIRVVATYRDLVRTVLSARALACFLIIAGGAMMLAHRAYDWRPGKLSDFGGHNRDWWIPGCHILPGTFDYPRQVDPLLNALTIGFIATNNTEYLEPLESMASLVLSFLDTPESERETQPTGSALWAAGVAKGQVLKASLNAVALGLPDPLLQRTRELVAREYASNDDGARNTTTAGYTRYRLGCANEASFEASGTVTLVPSFM